MLVSLALEQNIESMSVSERVEYIGANPTHISADSAIVLKCFDLLNLIRFYTINQDKEVKCWLLRRGSNLIDAAALVELNISRYVMSLKLEMFDNYSCFAERF